MVFPPFCLASMSKATLLGRVLDCGIVAVVRTPESQRVVEIVRALADGGIDVVEVTMTVPNALAAIRDTCQALGSPPSWPLFGMWPKHAALTAVSPSNATAAT